MRKQKKQNIFTWFEPLGIFGLFVIVASLTQRKAHRFSNRDSTWTAKEESGFSPWAPWSVSTESRAGAAFSPTSSSYSPDNVSAGRAAGIIPISQSITLKPTQVKWLVFTLLTRPGSGSHRDVPTPMRSREPQNLCALWGDHTLWESEAASPDGTGGLHHNLTGGLTWNGCIIHRAQEKPLGGQQGACGRTLQKPPRAECLFSHQLQSAKWY